MDGNLVLDVHLVKLIDATDAVVRQHERTRLNSKLIVLRLFHHRCCQASSSGGLAGGIHSSGQEAGHILQDLGLGTRWVAHDANVDVATQGYALARVLVHPTKQHQQHCLLDGVVAPHAGHHAARQLQVHLWIVLHSQDFIRMPGVKLIQHLHGAQVIVSPDVHHARLDIIGHNGVGDEHEAVRHLTCTKRLHREALASSPLGNPPSALAAAQRPYIWHHHQRARGHNLVAGFGLLHLGMADNDIYGAWQAAARHLPWVLLDFDALPVHKYTLLAHKAPCLAVTACGVGADDGLGVLELLLDVTDCCGAVQTAEGPQVQFRPHFTSSCDRAGETGQHTHFLYPQVPQLVALNHVDNGDIELLVTAILLPRVLWLHLPDNKLHSLAQGGLQAVV
mmetsp:Transcript_1705/g.4287  ORF Transcript_1705/g.4287 Transcript_1705/m.4287 type:complete len:393 (+) Transcript_1705:1338-2516(+)